MSGFPETPRTRKLTRRAHQVLHRLGDQAYAPITVIDSFGDLWPITAPQDWSLFATTGLGPNYIVLWSTARTPLAGPVLDQVVIGIDEDADLIWAVEQIIAGQTLPTPTRSPNPRPSKAIRPHSRPSLPADDTHPPVLAPLRHRRPP
jgi:hypothetical protein